tara:strand:+ start:232 stop:678 length:447 start_codon:yes stop_codon:yes gene_type:complete
MNNTVYIFTDGACRGNPGEGGWGAILQSDSHEKEISGYSKETTNNIMELTAVIRSLQALKKSCNIILTTDSKYVQNGITTWIHNWKKNGWKTANKKNVKNKDLWIVLDEECKKHKIKWKWIKGHSGHVLNERADLLANLAIDNKGGEH